MASVLEISPAVFPYHALVSSKYLCAGIIVSEEYVVCPAHCVNNTAWGANVYMGFTSSSYAFFNHFLDFSLLQISTEIVHTHDITVHEDFTKVSKNVYLNNIALVKFPYKIRFRKTLQPGIFMPNEEYQSLTGETVLDVTGWKENKASNLSITTAQKVNQDLCSLLYGSNFFKDQESCLEWRNFKSHLNLPGNTVSSNGQILGFLINSQCSAEDSRCSDHTKFFTSPPFLSWISENANIDMAQLTGPKKGHYLDFSTRVDSLLESTEEVKLENLEIRKRLAKLQTKSMEMHYILQHVKSNIEKSCTLWNAEDGS